MFCVCAHVAAGSGSTAAAKSAPKAGYVRVVHDRMAAAAKAAEVPTARAPVITHRHTDITFFDALTVLADRAGLVLVPNTRRPTVEGNKLYSLGPASFYVYSDVVFLEKLHKVAVPSASGLHNVVSAFVPVSVDELLAAAGRS
jgi:hypothetical protein